MTGAVKTTQRVRVFFCGPFVYGVLTHTAPAVPHVGSRAPRVQWRRGGKALVFTTADADAHSVPPALW